MPKRTHKKTVTFKATVTRDLMGDVNALKARLNTDRAGVLKALVENWKANEEGASQ